MQTAIDRLKMFAPPNDKFRLAFSGGKDSQTIYHLAKESGVPFEAHYNVTGVDPTELVRFIKQNYPDVIFDYPKTTMWELIPKKLIPPTRIIRYCCEALKHSSNDNKTLITGVRWQESTKRKNNRAMLEINAYSRGKNKIMIYNDNDESRRLFETCAIKGTHILNPIVDWGVDDVWQYLKERTLPYCCLYDEGFRRIGCIGCPMSGTKGMEREFKRYPRFKVLYLKAFAKMLIEREKKGLKNTFWTDAESVMKWWIYGQDRKPLHVIEGQLSLFDDFQE